MCTGFRVYALGFRFYGSGFRYRNLPLVTNLELRGTLQKKWVFQVQATGTWSLKIRELRMMAICRTSS